MIIHGAEVTIIAGCDVEGVNTADARLAGIVSANIVVVTVGATACCTDPVDAEIGNRARIAIVAFADVGHVKTPLHWVAEVVGTEVSVVAGLGRARLTYSTIARIAYRARVAVVTRFAFLYGKQLTLTGGWITAIVKTLLIGTLVGKTLHNCR